MEDYEVDMEHFKAAVDTDVSEVEEAEDEMDDEVEVELEDFDSLSDED